MLVNSTISSEEFSGELEIRKDVTEGIWRKRIVVLSGPCLLIYKSAKQQAKGEIKRKIEFHLTSTCVEVLPVEFVAYRNDQPRPKIKKNFCFKVSADVLFGQYGSIFTSSLSTIYFAAPDEQEKQKWIQRITYNMENYKKTTECLEKHNQLVRDMKAKYGSNWNHLQIKTDASTVQVTLSHNPQSNNPHVYMDSEAKAPQAGSSKKDLETKVLRQEQEIADLKQRLESLERTVAEMRKLQ